MALVAADTSYDIHFSSSPPKKLRFRLLNADANFKIQLSVYYYSSQRIDLYNNDIYIPPTNADYKNGDMVLKEPTADNLPLNTGDNLHSKLDSRTYFMTDGASLIDLKIAPVLFVRFGFPAITPEQFFNPVTLVLNFAGLLGVSPSKIRRVEIVRASRRRRQISSINIINVIIEDNAAASEEEFERKLNEMKQLEANISNLYLTGQLQNKFSNIMNVTLTECGVQAPSSVESVKELVEISKIAVVQAADGCSAQTPCQVQPVLMVVDTNVSAFYAECFLGTVYNIVYFL